MTTTDAAPAGTESGATTPEDQYLNIDNVEVVYNDVALVLRGLSLSVPKGAIVALLGANGAGKTTLLRTATGLLGIHRGAITKGSVYFDGRDITGVDPAKIVRSGIGQVMEGRRIFAELTVEENLRSGAYTRRNRGEVAETYQQVMDMFPALQSRQSSTAGYLSGGEQQMVAIGRALMASPKMLFLDEPSLGLAPKIVDHISQIIVDINATGTTVLLVEQNARMALSVASHGYILEHGRIVKEGPGHALLNDKDIQEFYLGVSGEGRKSFREIKTYRRKKGWDA